MVCGLKRRNMKIGRLYEVKEFSSPRVKGIKEISIEISHDYVMRILNTQILKIQKPIVNECNNQQ